jgi:hypothetical protein
MSALRELQQGMIDRILREKDAAGLPIAPEPPFTPGQRLNVYKNNTHVLLRDLLKDTFPVTTILLGGEFMAYAAHEFILVAPPEGGDMNAYGADFPAFLGHMPNVNKFAYVPDVARLEWLAHEAYLSPRGPVLTGQDLAAVADPVNLQLYLQPHIHLLRSGWPVDKLWSRVNEEGAGLRDFEMKPAETFAAIFRAGDRISVWSITEGGYRFLECLQSGPSFALAAEAALRAEPGLSLDRLLAALLQQGLLAKHQG